MSNRNLHFATAICGQLTLAVVLLSTSAQSQSAAGQAKPSAPRILLQPERVFDGEQMRAGFAVLIEGQRIVAVGPADDFSASRYDKIQRFPGQTLMPGLIEGHSHLLLHPYDETSWTDQVLAESIAERVARATVHAQKSLHAGFTTLRDLGSEGAGYADVGLKQAIEKGVIPGPRLLVAGPAIVTTGSYGPKGFAPQVTVPLGAETADGENLRVVVRDQIGKGADFIKVYADYRWGPDGSAQPTFSLDELTLIVSTAASSGRDTVAHASTAEGMRRAVLAGVTTIEHGDGATKEVLELMRDNNVALCPTLAAYEAIARYSGWNGEQPFPARIERARKMLTTALEVGVELCAGGDVGVYDHGDNAWELELMVDYGMPAIDVLRAATSVNARLFGLTDRGRIAPGLLADLVLVEGDPSQQISILRSPQQVFKGGHPVL